MSKLMILGTGSSVGKSIVVAGLCRALSNRGLSVAPFKSQNMSNNSYITDDGKEMGRAQAFQAQAARILPSARMNPILLKPTTDVGSQVVVMGEVYGNYTARAYFQEKKKLLPIAVEAFRSLENEYDYVLIEGAGSPAEINLRSLDIVNMGFAQAIDAKVVLVGDVDRGGVFAALYGTYMLLAPEEQERVAGFIINKFRGDVTLLEPGIRQIEEMMGIPCLGVLPYIKKLAIDDEDSANERLAAAAPDPARSLKIAVVQHPHISNATDFTVFQHEDDVALHFVTSPDALRGADMVVLPGSKSTIADMAWLQDTGIAAALQDCAKAGVPLLGICGGYQMLGRSIVDPDGVDGAPSRSEGLGLLPVVTEMQAVKTTSQSTGTIQTAFLADEEAHLAVTGYEIHMGKTSLAEARGGDRETALPWIVTGSGVDGYRCGSSAGTYFHGIFDNDELRTALLNALRLRRGLPVRRVELSARTRMDREYDRLADVIEEHVQVDRLLAIMRT